MINIDYITLQAFFEENIASKRVMEKCGMIPIGKEEYIEYRGVVHRCVYYSIKQK